ncbi:Histidine kinase [Pelomyxa schiedti]|nr:Histidine kinase [Pelomyxa schiedti]
MYRVVSSLGSPSVRVLSLVSEDDIGLKRYNEPFQMQSETSSMSTASRREALLSPTNSPGQGRTSGTDTPSECSSPLGNSHRSFKCSERPTVTPPSTPIRNSEETSPHLDGAPSSCSNMDDDFIPLTPIITTEPPETSNYNTTYRTPPISPLTPSIHLPTSTPVIHLAPSTPAINLAPSTPVVIITTPLLSANSPAQTTAPSVSIPPIPLMPTPPLTFLGPSFTQTHCAENTTPAIMNDFYTITPPCTPTRATPHLQVLPTAAQPFPPTPLIGSTINSSTSSTSCIPPPFVPYTPPIDSNGIYLEARSAAQIVGEYECGTSHGNYVETLCTEDMNAENSALKEVNAQPISTTPLSSTVNPILAKRTAQESSVMPEQIEKANGHNWNDKMQDLCLKLKQLTPNTHAQERLQVYKQLADLAHDFVHTVKNYGRIIISEVHFPVPQKTIKPTNAIGGIAGGDKYLVHQILFKFAVDSRGMYDGDENAAKVAGHELRSLSHLFSCWENDIALPLMATIDYRGYRLIGITLLPIGKETLIYGSDNAGRSGVRYDPIVDRKLTNIAKQLNLKRHRVGEGDNWIYTPIDLEAHHVDGKYYLVDTSRLFPPQGIPKQQHNRCTYLFRLLRPEFVKKYSKPLCNDVYSPFVCPKLKTSDRCNEIRQNEQEIEDATRYLETVTINSFVEDVLLKVPVDNRNRFPLIVMLHQNGINVRLLGIVYSRVVAARDKDWEARILIEMVVRVVKCEVNSLLRKIRMPGEGPYRSVVVDHLNLVFGTSPTSTSHWQYSIFPALKAKFTTFDVTGPDANQFRQMFYQRTLIAGMKDARCLLFEHLTHQLGLYWDPTTWRITLENPSVFECYLPFTDTDLAEFRERVKQMNIASHARGFVLKTTGLQAKTSQERKRLLNLAIEQFSQARAAIPDNKVTLRNLGDCLSATGRHEEAYECYLRAFMLIATIPCLFSSSHCHWIWRVDWMMQKSITYVLWRRIWATAIARIVMPTSCGRKGGAQMKPKKCINLLWRMTQTMHVHLTITLYF